MPNKRKQGGGEAVPDTIRPVTSGVAARWTGKPLRVAVDSGRGTTRCCTRSRTVRQSIIATAVCALSRSRSRRARGTPSRPQSPASDHRRPPTFVAQMQDILQPRDILIEQAIARTPLDDAPRRQQFDVLSGHAEMCRQPVAACAAAPYHASAAGDQVSSSGLGSWFKSADVADLLPTAPAWQDRNSRAQIRRATGVRRSRSILLLSTGPS